VLRLGKQVRGHPARVHAAVADHQYFRGPGDHVDADAAENLALGLGHVAVTGADDLVDARQAGRAVGQGGHGLRTAHAVQGVDPGQGRRGEYQRVALAAGVGATMITSRTPATRAGIAFISTDDG
jgi:hypothetical protein